MTEPLQTWCLGLPLVAERPLTAEETQALQRDLRNVTLGAVAGCLGSVAGIPAWMGALLLTGHHPGWMLLAFIGGPVVIGACVLQGYRCACHAARLRAERRTGTVSCFAGTATQEIFPLLQSQLFRPFKRALAVGQACSFELYSHSGRVKSVQGHPVRTWDKQFMPAVTAPVPDQAAIAALWLEEIDRNAEDLPILAGQRELTADELAEMRWYTIAAWWFPLRRSLWLACLPGGLAIVALLRHKPIVGPMIFLGLFLVLGIGGSLLGVRRGRAFAASRRTGLVRIFRVPLSADPNATLLLEVLLDTDVPWTIDGQPAPWRRT